MLSRLARPGSGALGIAVVLTLLAPGPTVSQVSAMADLNLPYLHYFGFGAFKIGDHDVWALRGRTTPSLIDYRPRKVGLAARLSGSLVGIDVGDILEQIDNATVATVAVGGEIRVNMSPRSLLRLYADVGSAFDLDTGARAALLATGGLWELVFPWKGMEIGLQPNLDFVGSAVQSRRLDDRILAAQVKVDLRRYLGFHIWGNRAQFGGYMDLAHFTGDTALSSSDGTTGFGVSQFELGITFGTHPRPKIILFRPLLNVGFRWGSSFRGIRIGLGDRLTRLPPVP